MLSIKDVSHISPGWVPCAPRDRTGHRNIHAERRHQNLRNVPFAIMWHLECCEFLVKCIWGREAIANSLRGT